MIPPQRNFTAISALCALLCGLVLALSGTALAEPPVGAVIDLSGVLLVRKADGGMKILAQKSTVDRGDTLVSQKVSYARIKFSDNSEITLKPDTQLTVTDFAYDAAKPENDKEVLTLAQGGVRVSGGLLGKRSKAGFQLVTPTSSIDIGGAVVVVEYVPPSQRAQGDNYGVPGAIMAVSYEDFRLESPAAFYAAIIDSPRLFSAGRSALMPAALIQLAQNTPPTAPTSGGLAPGLYVQVIDGIINLSNKGGSQNFSAGQFGFTASFVQPPVVVPANPGLKFTPPPAFSSTTGPQTSTAGSKPGAVDCEVR